MLGEVSAEGALEAGAPPAPVSSGGAGAELGEAPAGEALEAGTPSAPVSGAWAGAADGCAREVVGEEAAPGVAAPTAPVPSSGAAAAGRG